MAWPAIIAAVGAVVAAGVSAKGQKDAAVVNAQGGVATAQANTNAQLAEAASRIGQPPPASQPFGRGPQP